MTSERSFKVVTRYGMEFTVLSERERMASLGDRHFYCKGRDCDGWTLFEFSHGPHHRGGSKILGRKFEYLDNTQSLVEEIRRLVEISERLPTDVRPPWVIDKQRYNAMARPRIARSYAALRMGDVTIYRTLRHCGAVLREFWFTTVADEFDGEATQNMAHHFDARDLPEQYRVGDSPLAWIRHALAHGFQLEQIQTLAEAQP